MNEQKRNFTEYDRLNGSALKKWLKLLPYSKQRTGATKLLTEAALKNIVARQWATFEIARISLDGS